MRIPVAIPTIALITLASTACGVPAALAQPGRSNSDAARISRVERGLLPTVAVRGRRDTAYTLADRMKRFGTPGVSLAVIDQGRVAWVRAWGVIDSGGARIDTATLFQAGSISKAITAVAALCMVDREVLRLDDDVNQKLTSWKVPTTDRTQVRPVTLRGLLSHGAGFNVPSFPGYEVGTPVPTLLQVLDGAPPTNTQPVRVVIEPGTEWRYSGGGYTVVQQLIADAAGRGFEDVLRENVFSPAGMTRTLAAQPLSAPLVSSAAIGHSGSARRRNVYPELAAAGLWSTAPDLARFGVSVLRAIRGERGALLTPGTAHAMVTRQIGDWGLGFALGGGAGDSLTVGHGGSTAGYVARLIVLPATGQGLAIMTNGESEALIDEIQRSVAREYAWPVRPRVEKQVATADPATYVALSGQYRVALGDRNVDFQVEVDGARLILTGPSGRPGELLPVSELQFFSQDTGNEFTFTREGNAVTGMVIDQQGQRFTARRR
jgi:CubicO group peptidase (beta-lactamase class C family)